MLQERNFPCLLLASQPSHAALQVTRVYLADTEPKQKSWMDGMLFEEWVKEQDTRFEGEKRNIALIIDNCPAHPVVNGLKAIKLIFLPPNTTPKTQPMDQGVIRSLKAKYRLRAVQKCISAIDRKQPLPKFTILEAKNILVASWDAVEASSVINCFKTADISLDSQRHAASDKDDPFRELTEELSSLRERNAELEPSEITAEQFAGLDNVVSQCENSATINDDDILAEFIIHGQVSKTDDEGKEEEEEEEEESCPPSKREVRESLDTLYLQSFFLQKGSEIKHKLRSITYMIEREFQSRQNQSTMNQFFKKILKCFHLCALMTLFSDFLS